MKFPKRPKQHNLEELSRRFFQSCLPNNWTTTRQEIDYGVDLVVHIFDGENASPYEIYIQLKSSKQSAGGEYEKVVLRVATYNYLLNMLPVVLIVKYVEDINEAFYILLAKIPPPNQDQESFTINIPKSNILSNLDWTPLETTVRHIIDYKLNAGREVQAEMKKQGLL